MGNGSKTLGLIEDFCPQSQSETLRVKIFFTEKVYETNHV